MQLQSQLKTRFADVPSWAGFQKGSVPSREKERGSILLLLKEEEELLFIPMIWDMVGVVLLNVWPEDRKCRL